MSQVTGPLSINDGSATPVAKSFQPERVAPDSSSFTERSSGVSAGFSRFQIGLSPANSNRPTNRIDLSLDLPVLQTVNGVSTVAYVCRFKGYFVLPDVATAADRANARAFVANALDNSQVISVIRDLDPLY